MILNKKELVTRGFITVPAYNSMEAFKKGNLKLHKREDAKYWRCYISEAWHSVKTTEQLDFLLKIVNNE